MKYFKRFVFSDVTGRTYYHIYRNEKFLLFFDNVIQCTSYPLVKEAADILLTELNENQ